MAVLAITGAGGLLGFHLRAFLHARHRNQYDRIVLVGRDDFDNEARLGELLWDCDCIVHLAALIAGPADDILSRNRTISEVLTKALDVHKKPRHLVFASSTHIDRDTPYGQSKRNADAHFSAFCNARGYLYTPIVFPNIFGEGGLAFYNSVVSTFCSQLVRGRKPEVRQDAMLSLMHAQRAAQCIADILLNKKAGTQTPKGEAITVSGLLSKLEALDRDRRDFIIPDLRSPLDLDLYNTLRSYIDASDLPQRLKVRSDDRGSLFESLRTKHGGQVFISTTRPDITRGNHFHLHKLERFCVISGEANIRIRKLFSNMTNAYHVSGEYPCVLDIPTLHTHSIINLSNVDLITMFWAHEIFDPGNPDTYPEPVDLHF